MLQATATSDRTCLPARVCDEVMEFMTAELGPTNNRVCQRVRPQGKAGFLDLKQ